MIAFRAELADRTRHEGENKREDVVRASGDCEKSGMSDEGFDGPKDDIQEEAASDYDAERRRTSQPAGSLDKQRPTEESSPLPKTEDGWAPEKTARPSSGGH